MHSEDVFPGESQPCLLDDGKVESSPTPRTLDSEKSCSPAFQVMPPVKSPKRNVIRYILLAALAIGIIIAVVCAAVLVTKSKHQKSVPSNGSSPAGKTPANTTVQDDIQTMSGRRLSVIVGGLENATSVSGW